MGNCKLVVKAIVLSALVCAALAGPCSDNCQGVCNVAKTQCGGSLVLGPLCAIGHGSCMMGCGHICVCEDGCLAKCQPAATECNENAAGNMISELACAHQLDSCML